MKCGRPIPCASERATRTACAEQHDASASFSSSAHSSSVTATASPPARAHSSAATAESTPPLMATSVRRGSARERRVGAGGEAERAVQRVGRQLGGVQLAGREPAQLGGDRVRADARGVEHARALDERDGGGAGGGGGAAARGLEAGRGDAPALDPQGDRDEVAASSAAGGSDGAAGGLEALPLRKLKMLGEAFGAHAPSLGRWPRSS